MQKIKILLLFFFILLLSNTLQGEKLKKENHMIPLFLSMTIPGGGQFYNKSYFKGGIYAALEFSLAGAVYYSINKKNESEDKIEKLKEQINGYNRTEMNKLKKDAEYYSNNRDKYIWLTAASILLSMGDAYVDSYFKNFKKDIIVKGDKISLVPSGNKISLIYNW